MAHMIPDDPPEFGPGMGAETALYEALQSQLPDDFFVYHGLHFLEGVRRTGTGQWFRMCADGREWPLKEDPFHQAQRTVKDLVKELRERLQSLMLCLEGRFPFLHGHAVAFPFAFVDELNTLKAPERIRRRPLTMATCH